MSSSIVHDLFPYWFPFEKHVTPLDTDINFWPKKNLNFTNTTYVICIYYSYFLTNCVSKIYTIKSKIVNLQFACTHHDVRGVISKTAVRYLQTVCQ